MKCPKCGTIMELEDVFENWRTDSKLELQENYWCSACDHTLTRTVIYAVEKETIEE